MDCAQTLPANYPDAVDAVYFNGGNVQGDFIVLAVSRRHKSLMQVYATYVIHLLIQLIFQHMLEVHLAASIGRCGTLGTSTSAEHQSARRS